MASTRRPRKAKKAVLVIDAIAAEPDVLEPGVAPAKPKRTRSAPRTRQVAEPAPEPVSAAHRALLAALEASAVEPEPSADEGVIYERAASPLPRGDGEGEGSVPADVLPSPAEPSLHSGSSTSSADQIVAQLRPPLGPGARGKAILKAIDGLPPIRLPLGPAIPWRFGLPGLLGLVLVMLVLGRPTAHAESHTRSFKLPAESETYAVTQDSPLFTQSQQPQQQQPIGVAEPAGLNVDVLDLTLKLLAVLALAYGSLVVLKRVGIGGAGSSSSQGQSAGGEGLRVISTLALAPNRSIHVVRAPDGKTLLLGATPGQVNLIAELGDVPEVEAGGSGSFLDILTSKLQQH